MAARPGGGQTGVAVLPLLLQLAEQRLCTSLSNGGRPANSKKGSDSAVLHLFLPCSLLCQGPLSSSILGAQPSSHGTQDSICFFQW